MQPYFLNPHVKETSPYGSNVCETLSNFLTSIDKNIMDLHLKQVCSIIGDTLKRQCGDQYGFGENPDSEFLVTKNTTNDMLDDSDATHTKRIENYYGNFD